MHCALQGCVIYLDTEKRFSSTRLVEIAKARWPARCSDPAAVHALTSSVLIFRPFSSAELLQLLKSMEEVVIEHRVQLLIIDSIAVFVRAESGQGNSADRQVILAQQASILKRLADRCQISVIVTNQVAGAGRDAEVSAALGVAWAHAVNARLVLENYDTHKTLTVGKSPATASYQYRFSVTAAGLELQAGEMQGAQESTRANAPIHHSLQYIPSHITRQ